MSTDSSDLEMDNNFNNLVDSDEIKFKVVKDLNAIFGSDIKNLKKAEVLVNELKKRKENLEQKLKFATTEAPDKLSKAVKAAEEGLKVKNEILKKCTSLSQEVDDHNVKIKPILDLITPGVNQIKVVECAKSYERWKNAVADINTNMEMLLKSGNEQQMMLKYGELKDLVNIIEPTNCLHLKDYTNKTLVYWHAVLYDKLRRDYEAVLKAMKWPFTSMTASRNFPNLEDNLNRLSVLTKHLLNLNLPPYLDQSISDNSLNGTSVPGIVANFSPLLPPLYILFHPFEIRFHFHFSGKKATNSLDNPEWYFTQVLQWISLHDAFLQTWIQPVFQQTQYKDVSVKVEFMRTLVRLVILKLNSTLPSIKNDEDLFCRTLQETLNFERELRLGFNYPVSQPSVLTVLTQAHNFNRWITLERKFALELMDEIVSGEDAWHAIDQGEAAHCGEQLILLLQGITDRYKPLPEPGHRLQFLELQLDLVDDFRVRVLQLTKSEMSDLLNSNYGAILNTVGHIANTLTDWDNIPFFIEMQYYREQLTRFEQMSSYLEQQSVTMSSNSGIYSFQSVSSPSGPEVSLDSSYLSASSVPHEVRKDAMESLNQKVEAPSVKQLIDVKSSVFEEAIKLYLRIQADMTNTMAEHLLTEVRARSQSYRKDKWFLSNQDGQPKLVVIEVSPSFCLMIDVLNRNLLNLRTVLNSTLFTNLWHKIASSLDKFIYEEVILQNHFSEYGAQQLKYDMYQALFPIFGEFTSKPQNYFKLIKESIILLNLHRPTAKLLKETLKLSQEDRDTFSLSVSPVKALSEHGVIILTPREADTILNIRMNMGCD